MKRFLFFAVLLFAGNLVFGQGFKQAVGIRGGLTSGVEYRYYTSDQHSFKALLGNRSFDGRRGLQLHVLTEYYKYDLFDFSYQLVMYYGFGAHAGYENWDTIQKGDTLLLIENEAQKVNKGNAMLSESYYSPSNNRDQLNNLENSIRVAKQKKEFDSLQYVRQKKLYQEGVGIEVDLDMAKLNYENSVINYNTAVNQLSDFRRQLNFNSSQARNNVRISSISENEFILTSEIDGMIYALDCSEGELVSPQRPLGVVGSAREFIIEMLIDEADIMEVHLGQKVVVTLDSYEGKVFEAFVTKIYPLMDLNSKSFKIEAEFVHAPEVLYPNMNFEANVIINSKEDALLIPREYVLEDNVVILENGDSIQIETGLKDYRMIEVLSGITESDRIILPQE